MSGASQGGCFGLGCCSIRGVRIRGSGCRESGKGRTCEAGRDTSRDMLFRRRRCGRVRSISGRRGGAGPIGRWTDTGQYPSGRSTVLDARLASEIIQISIFGAMWYEEMMRAPSVTASWFALMSSGDRLDQSPVACRSSNVSGLTAWGRAGIFLHTLDTGLGGRKVQ
jgi:hypothetical protein